MPAAETQNDKPKDKVSLKWLLGITKEVVGIRVLLPPALFGDGILRRFFRRVFPAKPTSAVLQY
jgi:hypothetical protein